MASPVGPRRSIRRTSPLWFAGLILFVLAAGCEGGGTSQTNGSASPPDSEPVSSSVPGALYDLAYGFAPGQSYRYGVLLEQHIVLTTEGESSAVLNGEIPGSADVTAEAEGVFVFEVAEGPRTGTFEVVVTGEFDDVVFDGDADGQPVDGAGNLAQLGTFDPFTKSIVVDRQGRLVDDQEVEGDPVSPGGSTFAGISGDIGQLPGPVLTEDPVGIGDGWTAAFDDPSLGDDPVEVRIEAELVGVQSRDDGDIFTITGESTTGEATTDLADLFSSIFSAADPEGQGNVNLDGIVFSIVTAPSTSTTTADFDPGRGVAIAATTTGTTALTMDVALPASEADGFEEFSMSLLTDQTIRYTLLEGTEP